MIRAILCLFCLLTLSIQARLQPQHVAVIYNEKSAHSKECALLYAKLRRIPERNIIPLSIDTKKHDITTQEFVKLIHEPLLAIGKQRELRYGSQRGGKGVHHIFTLLMMPDLPLRISPRQQAAGEKAPAWQNTTAASVDSELALLGSGDYDIDTMTPNPYFLKKESIVLSGYKMLPVCRIDSPSKEVNLRMITQPITVEQAGGLRGWIVVDNGGPYKDGDKWFSIIAEMAIQAKQPLLLDALRSSLPIAYPMPHPTALYFGWYEGRANGPFALTGPKQPSFNFAKGAVAVHLHSFSATTVRNIHEGWVGTLLAQGADVSAGNVWEPYLGGTLLLPVFYERLLQGYCVAEAAGMSTPQVSWQGIVMGDPLYRPYPNGVKAVATNPGMEACYLQALGQHDKAIPIFQRIVQESRDSSVRMRSQLCIVQSYLLMGKKAEAKKLLEHILNTDSQSPYFRAAEMMMRTHFPS